MCYWNKLTLFTPNNPNFYILHCIS